MTSNPIGEARLPATRTTATQENAMEQFAEPRKERRSQNPTHEPFSERQERRLDQEEKWRQGELNLRNVSAEARLADSPG